MRVIMVLGLPILHSHGVKGAPVLQFITLSGVPILQRIMLSGEPTLRHTCTIGPVVLLQSGLRGVPGLVHAGSEGQNSRFSLSSTNSILFATVTVVLPANSRPTAFSSMSSMSDPESPASDMPVRSIWFTKWIVLTTIPAAVKTS